MLLHVGVGVEADRRDVVELLVHGAVVERLDVGEGVGELVARDAHLVGGEAVEHEGVVGVGAVGDRDFTYSRCCGGHQFLQMLEAERLLRECRRSVL